MANNIRMPDCIPLVEASKCEEDSENYQKLQQLINFGHSQWGFNNWSWAVTSQEKDFVEFTNNKYYAGVVAFVSVTVKTFEISRENIGYATCTASTKGKAIYKARKYAVTNALRETLFSFGGGVASELIDQLDGMKEISSSGFHEPLPDSSQSQQKCPEAKSSVAVRSVKKDFGEVSAAPSAKGPVAPRAPTALPPSRPPAPRAAPVPHAPLRPNSNVSFVLQPVMPPMYPSPRLAPPVAHQHVFPNYYEYSGPWHFAYEGYERAHGNVNLNFNLPPKNLVVNGRGECKSACRGAEGEPLQYGPAAAGAACWTKPTLFYDGFWTEQKVKKWVAEQVEKQFPDDGLPHSSSNNPPPSDPSSKS